jgi:hypothetical protein
MSRVRASATIRNARGETGHPWGTPQLTEKGALCRPLILTRRWGGWAGSERRVARLMKWGPKSRAVRAAW